MNRVWADAVVEESNLSQCLCRLRKTLGERADGEIGLSIILIVLLAATEISRSGKYQAPAVSRFC